MYLERIWSDNHNLYMKRELYLEKDRIMSEYKKEYEEAWMIMFENFDPFTPGRSQKTYYLEVKNDS